MPLTYNVYFDSTHMRAVRLTEARGGGVGANFPVSITFNENMSFSTKNQVCEIKKNHKIIHSQLWDIESNRYQEKCFDI